jgi:hypothetical protein
VTQSSPSSWSERLTRVHPLLVVLCVVALALLLADLLYDKHGYFAAENVFAFYPLCGLICPLLIVLVARGVRPLIQREVDYYDD